jgi:hypothetical protein
MRLLATAKEAVSNAQIEISTEGAEASSGASRPRTREKWGPEQPDVCQRPANL